MHVFFTSVTEVMVTQWLVHVSFTSVVGVLVRTICMQLSDSSLTLGLIELSSVSKVVQFCFQGSLE